MPYRDRVQSVINQIVSNFYKKINFISDISQQAIHDDSLLLKPVGPNVDFTSFINLEYLRSRIGYGGNYLDYKKLSDELRRYVYPAFTHLKLRELNADHIEEFKKDLEKTNLRAKKINFQLAILEDCLRLAKLLNRIEKVPNINYIEIPKPVEKQKFYVTPVALFDLDVLFSRMKEFSKFITDKQRRAIEIRYGLLDGDAHSVAETAALLHVSKNRARELEAIVCNKLNLFKK